MVNFECNECGFRFDSTSQQAGKKCPYCGRGKLAEEKSAEDLLEEE